MRTGNDEVSAVLIDSSGSTLEPFVRGEPSGQVFAKELLIVVDEINTPEYFLMFWNSTDAPNFPGGVFSVPYVVKKDKVNQWGQLAQAKMGKGYGCTTFPHVALTELMRQKWMDKCNNVYIVCDGQISPGGHQPFIRSLTAFFLKFPRARLHIKTVDAFDVVDYANLESVAKAAGGDMIASLKNANLMDKLASFVSYDLIGNKHSHINRCMAPDDCYPFGEQYFLKSDVHLFIPYVRRLIASMIDDADKIASWISVAQRLCEFIKPYILDRTLGFKPDRVEREVAKILEFYASLFCVDAAHPDTNLDQCLVFSLLETAVSSDARNQAMIYANYRDSLQQIFKNAESMLAQDVKNALAARLFSVMSLIIDGDDGKVVFVGTSRLMDEKLTLNGGIEFRRAGMRVGAGAGDIVGVVPCVPSLDMLTPHAEQCLRQWTRALLVRMHGGVDKKSDVCIYIVAAHAILARASAAMSPAIKAGFRTLARVMWRKKNAREDVTELALLKRDGPRVFNPLFITAAMKTLGMLAAEEQQQQFTADLHTLLTRDDDDEVAVNEYAPLREVVVTPQPEYKCLITLDDTTETGGWGFEPHGACAPLQVLSEEGYNFLVKQHVIYCPVCRQELPSSAFIKVSPACGAGMGQNVIFKNPFNEAVPFAAVAPFAAAAAAAVAPSAAVPSAVAPSAAAPSAVAPSAVAAAAVALSGPPGEIVVVQFRAPTGSGKTVATSELKAALEGLEGREGGVTVYRISVDQHVQGGMSQPSALARTFNDMRIALMPRPGLTVVVVDVCGAGDKAKVFDCAIGSCRMIKWAINQPDKFADQTLKRKFQSWALRNVLRRSAGDSPLNPVLCGVATCVDVHAKKCEQANVGKPNPALTSKTTVEAALLDLQAEADAYQAYLDAKLPLAAQVAAMVKKIVN